jgi:putative endonuclease
MNTPPAHIETGRYGEALAAAHLEAKGYRIAERNYRAGRGEIDLIAWTPDGGQLVFVEVKTRSGDGFGGPEEAVNRDKQRILVRCAGAYMTAIGYAWEVRFDIVAVVLQNGRLVALRHIEDAFFPR